MFVEKQDAADILLKELMRHGYPCLSLHGGMEECLILTVDSCRYIRCIAGMDQSDRDSTISDFKNAVTKLLVSRLSVCLSVCLNKIVFFRLLLQLQLAV